MIDIGLHEVGLSGAATVLAIGPCDVDSRETRPGMSIVTGTIRHRNATVWDLTFDDRTEETLGVTANHPLYSETRHSWIPAGNLQLDEVVRTLNGHSTLTARTQRPTRESVFNLEVHRSHAYHLSGLGVLAHNNILDCAAAGRAREGREQTRSEGRFKDASVQRERYLRTADGKRAIDPWTNKARRIDHAVIENGQVRYLVETTSKTADTASQMAKEARIGANGGTCVRDQLTGERLDVSEVLTRIMRVK